MNRFALACACAVLGAMFVMSGCDACFPSSSFESSPTPLSTTRVTGLPEARPSPTTRPANGACDLSVSRFLPAGDRSCAVLEVRKTAPANIEAGSTFTYRIEVTNLTPTPLQEVVIKETLPEPFEITGATAGATRSGSTIQWDVGTLEASASRSFAIRGASPNGGNIMGATRVDYAMGPVHLDMQVARAEMLPPVPSQATASPQALPADSHSPSRSEPSPSASNASRWAQDNDPRLAINISAPPRQRAGQNLVYVVHVANSGSTMVSGVIVTSLLPRGATFMEASDGGRQMNGQITWSVNSLAPGQTREFTVILKADRPGTLHTTAVATGRNASVSGEAVTLVEGSSATAAPGPQPQDSDR